MRWKKEKVGMSYIMYPTPLASPIFYQIRFRNPITNYSLTQSFILLNLNKADNPIIQKRAAKELLSDCRYFDVDFHSRHSLSAGGPGAFPAGVSYLPFQSTLF
jgi:hypothetical protein